MNYLLYSTFGGNEWKLNRNLDIPYAIGGDNDVHIDARLFVSVQSMLEDEADRK